MRFSQRKEIKPAKVPVQIDSIDNGLRNGLWSAISLNFLERVRLDINHSTDGCSHGLVLIRLWHNYFKRALDEYPKLWSRFVEFIRDYFFQCEWYEVYDFIESLIVCFNEGDEKLVKSMTDFMNGVMERDNCGYRIIDGKVADLTDEHTKESIEHAANQNRFSGAATHIKSAITLLYDRTAPNFRNSIKE